MLQWCGCYFIALLLVNHTTNSSIFNVRNSLKSIAFFSSSLHLWIDATSAYRMHNKVNKI